jgi:NADH-quinone oxidoreductase subunit M
VLGAAYMLWLYQRTMFGPCDNPKNQALKDLNWREIMTLVPLIVWAFWIGIYPKPFFKVLDKPVTAIVERVNPDFYRAAGANRSVPNQRVAQPLLAVQRAVKPPTQASAPAPPEPGGAVR